METMTITDNQRISHSTFPDGHSIDYKGLGMKRPDVKTYGELMKIRNKKKEIQVFNQKKP